MSKKSGLKDSVSNKSGLKVLNDRVLIKEDPIDYNVDPGSGLTKDVVDALKSSKLVVPDQMEHYVKKYPCTGEVLGVGDECGGQLKVGDRVIFARMGVMRLEHNGHKVAVCTIQDIHAVIT